MKFSVLLFLAPIVIALSGCLTPSVEDREYIVAYVVKTAGGIDTFREPGFVESREPAEGYEDSSAVRAVVKINYTKDGQVESLSDLRVSDARYESLIREFISSLSAEQSSVNDLNGLEHDFRVWVFENRVVHIEASR